MPIETIYRVTHKGEMKLETADRKEAEKYDKMLDVSMNIFELISQQGIELSENTQEEISIFLAKNKDPLTKLLKGKSFDDLKDEIVVD
tara:strand:+ start:1276 stop:1539 length:264 start_codon:yes stop_codon:yes gene_type:complete